MPYGQPPAYIALESIGRAIGELGKQTGTTTEMGVLGTTRNTYRTDQGEERELVTEALIGAAFAVAQTHVASVRPKTAAQQAVCHVANYWKHRDQWDGQWSIDRWNRDTVEAIRKLGASPPVVPGQLTRLAQAVLGQPFDWHSLWAALA